MKTQANKLLAVVCAIAMIMTMIVPMSITVSAEALTETITFDAAKTQRTSFSSTQQVWASDNVTFTNDKASSSTAVADYSNPVRLYGKSTVTIAASGTITQIVIVSDGTAKYKTALETALNDASFTYTTSDSTYTITGLNSDTITFTLTSNTQSRFKSIAVTYEPAVTGDPDCQHTNTTVLEAVAATCTEDGLTEGLQCADCEEILTKQTTVKATGHNLTVDESASTAATCTTDGTKVSTCSVCGETVTEVVKATGHTFVDYTCTACGETIDPTAETTATITFDDTAKRTEFSTDIQVWVENNITVTNNKASSTNNIADYSAPARFYKNSELIIAAPANITKIVFNCNTADYATALANSIGGVTADSKVVTVELAGDVATYTVVMGAQVRIDSIDVTYGGSAAEGDPDCPHTNTIVLEGKDATCTEEGLTEGLKCADCEKIITAQTTIAATGHGNLTLDTSKSTAPTCTESGENVYTCDVCGETSTETVVATGHTLVDNVCTVCGYTKDPSAVTEGSETITFDANKTQRESQTTTQQVWKSDNVTFINDKASSTNDIIDSSNPVRLYKNSTVTITAPNTITQIVIVSNGTSSYKTALENSLNAANLTYTVDGNTYTIDNIGSDSITITMAAQARFQSITVTFGTVNEGDPDCQHTNTKVLDAKAPTCTEDGLTEGLECADCGATITVQTVVPAAHNYVDNVCTVCGASEYTEATIAEALLMADGTKILIKNVVVAEINTAWNSTYNNITVTVKDQDTGDTLYVYRLGTNVAIGDIITIKGAMGSYNGSKQVAQGATAEITGQATVDGPDYAEVGLDEAATLDDGAYVSVTGTVTEINTAWSDSYQNISVTISDDNGNTLYIYRLATKVEIGDIITVKGKMATYNETRQVAEGTAEIIGKAEVTYNEVTIDEAIKLEDGALVLVTGTVTQINTAWSDSYGNISVTISDANGNTLYIYRLTTNVALGDVITVKGAMATYNEARQIAAGATAEIIGACEHTNTTTTVVTEATCTTEGVSNTVCAFCNKVISTETIPTTDHAWVAGDMVDYNITYTCSACGETKVEAAPYVAGDANADGKIDLSDVILIKVYLANYDYDTQLSTVSTASGADANGDGKIDLSDAVLLALYLANFDYETGSSTVVLGPKNA